MSLYSSSSSSNSQDAKNKRVPFPLGVGDVVAVPTRQSKSYGVEGIEGLHHPLNILYSCVFDFFV